MKNNHNYFTEAFQEMPPAGHGTASTVLDDDDEEYSDFHHQSFRQQRSDLGEAYSIAFNNQSRNKRRVLFICGFSICSVLILILVVTILSGGGSRDSGGGGGIRAACFFGDCGDDSLNDAASPNPISTAPSLSPSDDADDDDDDENNDNDDDSSLTVTARLTLVSTTRNPSDEDSVITQDVVTNSIAATTGVDDDDSAQPPRVENYHLRSDADGDGTTARRFFRRRRTPTAEYSWIATFDVVFFGTADSEAANAQAQAEAVVSAVLHSAAFEASVVTSVPAVTGLANIDVGTMDEPPWLSRSPTTSPTPPPSVSPTTPPTTPPPSSALPTQLPTTLPTKYPSPRPVAAPSPLPSSLPSVSFPPTPVPTLPRPATFVALSALYASTNGSHWTNKANWMDGDDPCSTANTW